MKLRLIGRTIRNYRKNTNMTIREFAEYSGISTSLISQLERGHGNPSLTVLELLATALNVPLYTLFVNDIDSNTLISHKNDRKKIFRKDKSHIVQDILTPDFMKSHIQLLTMELNGNSATTDNHYEHEDKEEIAVVIYGKVSVQLENEIYPLEEGDVVRIPARINHRFINNNDTKVTVLFVLVPSLI
ncbi:helix-turn-helix domain-containing protein [Clostridium cavendishii]|nr:XRE family transcriptional regulator [Clostridium cavendishii]